MVRLVDRAARVLILVAWMAAITYWSDQSTLPIDQPAVASALRGLQHKIAHLIAFGLLAVLARWTFDGPRRPALLALILVAAFGAFDEWHQSFIVGRRAAIDDWAVDVVAALLALYVWERRRSKHSVASALASLGGALRGGP